MLHASPFVDLAFVATALATAGVLLYALKEKCPRLANFQYPFDPPTCLDGRSDRHCRERLLSRLVCFAAAAVFDGVLPALSLIAIIFAFFRRQLVERLPLRTLTLIHLVRIPVELVLWQLSITGDVPQIMTFEGWNYDILSGMLAPFVYLIALRGDRVRSGILLAYNLLGLLLLANIVLIAILRRHRLSSSLPSSSRTEPSFTSPMSGCRPL